MSFDIFYEQFLSSLQALGKGYEIKDKRYKLALSDAIFCAEDQVRVERFYEAISLALRDLRQLFGQDYRICVVDAGAGTGVLGIMALLLGADVCYFLEHNPHTMRICMDFVNSFGLMDRAEFIQGDATKVLLEEPYDLLLSETLAADFVSEDFHRIVNHLLSFAKGSALVIPEKIELSYIAYRDYGEQGETGQIHVRSSDGFVPQQLPLAPETISLSMKLSLLLYHDVRLYTGECMSLGNTRDVLLEEEDMPYTVFV